MGFIFLNCVDQDWVFFAMEHLLVAQSLVFKPREIFQILVIVVIFEGLESPPSHSPFYGLLQRTRVTSKTYLYLVLYVKGISDLSNNGSHVDIFRRENTHCSKTMIQIKSIWTTSLCLSDIVKTSLFVGANVKLLLFSWGRNLSANWFVALQLQCKTIHYFNKRSWGL